MTDDQIRVEALLKIAKQQFEKITEGVDLLIALNRGDDMSSFRDISNDTAKRLESATAALLHAHNACWVRAVTRSQTAQLGRMN